MTSHASPERPVSAAATMTREPQEGHRPGRSPVPGPALLLGPVLVSVLLGVLTSYAQGWLPEETRSLANSAGPWALVALLASLVAPSTALAAAGGALSLGGLLVGYTIASTAQHHPSSGQFVVFWGAAAVLAGPALGLAGAWMRGPRPMLAGIGAGAIAGLLVGEGLYGLTYIADTTYPPYWAAEAGVGLLVLASGALRRPRSWARSAVSLSAAVLTAGAFVGIYEQDLIGRL